VRESDQEKKDRKLRTEFYNQWAAGVHHSGGKPAQSDMFELDELPTAASNTTGK
jgi:hypothetical protein